MASKMIPYDTRVRIVDAYRRRGNAREVADMFGIFMRQVYRLAANERAGKDLHPHTELRGRKPKLTQEHLAQIEARIKEKPDVTMLDLIHELSLPISESRLSRIVRKLGFRYKKKVIHASEQERPRRSGEEGTVLQRDCSHVPGDG